MTKIYLVRHGETDWNVLCRMQGRENTELNNQGRAQANQIGEYLKDQKLDILITSPLKRARETAEIVCEYLAIKDIIEIQEFIERDFGAASGLTSQEAKKLYPNGDILNIEDMQTLQERVMKGLNVLLERYKNKNIVVITHGAVINSIISIISKGTAILTKPGNGCISSIYHDDFSWNYEVYNSTSHLL